jgi:hypothetical protein
MASPRYRVSSPATPPLFSGVTAAVWKANAWLLRSLKPQLLKAKVDTTNSARSKVRRINSLK